MINYLKSNTKDTSELVRWAYQIKTKQEYLTNHREEQVYSYNKNRYFTERQLQDPDYQFKLKSIDEMNKEFEKVAKGFEKIGRVKSFRHVPVGSELSLADQTVHQSLYNILSENQIEESISIEQNPAQSVKSQGERPQDQTIISDQTQEIDNGNERVESREMVIQQIESQKLSTLKIPNIQQKEQNIVFQRINILQLKQQLSDQTEQFHVSEEAEIYKISASSKENENQVENLSAKISERLRE